jgi:TolB-like protein
MVIKNLSFLAVLVLSGCAVFEPLDDMFSIDEQTQDNEFSIDEQPQNDEFIEDLEDGSPLASSVNFQRQFKQNFQQQNDLATVAQVTKMLQQQSEQNSTTSYKEHDINHYVRGLMQDLVANLQYVNSSTPVAVVSFVMLNSNYNDANLLGKQIAESLIHEVHKFGIPVIDFKTTGYIRVTEQGDFAFSKDYEDFTGDMPARYIVGGTMLKHKDGYLINARIVGVQSQAVVASAQSFIPNSVSDPILMMSTVFPKSRILNNTVELGRVAFPLDFDASLVAELNENNSQQNQPMDKIAKRTSANTVYLIQE